MPPRGEYTSPQFVMDGRIRGEHLSLINVRELLPLGFLRQPRLPASGFRYALCLYILFPGLTPWAVFCHPFGVLAELVIR